MTMVVVPGAALGETEILMELLVAVGFVPKVTVTPVGTLDADRVTAPLKPPKSLTVTVLEPLPPCTMVTEGGLVARVKDGPSGPPK